MKLSSLNGAVDKIFAHFQERGESKIRLACPLGLGKPNELLNEIYERIKGQKHFSLDIYTALSLDLPDLGEGLQARFAKPFVERQFGKDYPRLLYLQDMRRQNLPGHINVYEFYVEAGRYRDNEYMQRHYVSLNYTHVARNLADNAINIIVQMVARRGDSYSLSCNPDLTLDVVDLLKEQSKPCLVVGVVHPDLPYLGGDAEVPAAFFDLILDIPGPSYELFALPRGPVDEVDSAIGFRASQLVVDDGTLQIGIGSLSDAIVSSLILRQNNPGLYKRISASLDKKNPWSAGALYTEPFTKGLYGTSEMLMDGFMHLRKAGILKRSVQDKGQSIYLHGAFFLGSKVFYQWLRDLKDEDYSGFSMTRVSKVNDLYDADETALRRQRKNARFFNTCMNVTLLGAAASDTLPDGRVISGVGGQYNFVAMSQELLDARSVLMLRSTSMRGGKRVSNLLWSHGQLTIPRHLRDVVVTEYGVAFLRGRTDEEVITQLIEISDVQFQDELMEEAKRHKKLAAAYRLPDQAKRNTPTQLAADMQVFKDAFPLFPFGSDFDPLEEGLLRALTKLKSMSNIDRAQLLLKSRHLKVESFQAELQRMGYQKTRSFAENIEVRLLLAALQETSASI